MGYRPKARLMLTVPTGNQRNIQLLHGAFLFHLKMNLLITFLTTSAENSKSRTALNHVSDCRREGVSDMTKSG